MVERTSAYRVPDFLPFQPMKLVDRPPTGAAWAHEMKFDGYRLQVRVERGRATLYTRKGNDWTNRFGDLAELARGLEPGIYDGEVCALDEERRPSFGLLQAALAGGGRKGLVYFAFDRLYDGGDDLRPFAYEARKARLRAAVEGAGAVGRIAMVEPLGGSGAALWRQACANRLEGIVSKRTDVRYDQVGSWVKAKCRPSQELVIGGWQTEKLHFHALLVGAYDGGKLRYAGRLKNGFARAPSDLVARLGALEEAASPFAPGEPKPPRKTSDIHWVRPELVAEAEIAEWLPSGRIRQASFKGLREDKDPLQVVREG